jgi:hypothetical protein
LQRSDPSENNSARPCQSVQLTAGISKLTAMTRSTLGQSLTPALNTWEELVRDGPAGPGIDFSEMNRTRLCCTRLEAFLDDPSIESFRKLWSQETLADYWVPNTASLLGPDNAVEHLHTLLSEISSADEFDQLWVDQLGGTGSGWGLYELFGRLQRGHEPIPPTEAQSVLSDLGYDVENNPNSVAISGSSETNTTRTSATHPRGHPTRFLCTLKSTNSFDSSKPVTGT